MRDILKMIRFDYIAVHSLTVPYVIGFLAVSLVLALFGIPLGLFSFVALAAIFAPAQELASSDSRKIYGILPLPKAAVTRAAFMEMTVPLLTGECISLLLLAISNVSKLYRILPEQISDIISSVFNYSENSLGIVFGGFGGICIVITLLSAYFCILSAYLEMKSEIQSREHDIQNVLTALAFTAVIVIGTTLLAHNQIIPPIQSWLIPRTTSGKWIFAILLNLIAIAVSVLFCEHTVKKTADREI